MRLLIIVSLVWAFSFGLIKGQLTNLDSSAVAFLRLAISLILFLPMGLFRRLPGKRIIELMAIGAVQYGVMYLSYIHSFQYLNAYEVALFTIFTPFYVTLLNDLLTRSFHRRFFLAAFLAVLGTGIIVYHNGNDLNLKTGFLLIQISNLSFAAGQILYCRTMKKFTNIPDHRIFYLLYAGATLITGIFALRTLPQTLLIMNSTQWSVLLYLGVMASGICFFLWNKGSRMVSAGSLAVMNNLKVPLAMTCSILFFNETGNYLRLIAGGLVIAAALLVKESRQQS